MITIIQKIPLYLVIMNMTGTFAITVEAHGMGKELNEAAVEYGVKTSTVKDIKTLFVYWTIRSYIQSKQDSVTDKIMIVPKLDIEKINENRLRSYHVAEFIINYLYANNGVGTGIKDEVLVGFTN